jgi:hypothetical protein
MMPDFQNAAMDRIAMLLDKAHPTEADEKAIKEFLDVSSS